MSKATASRGYRSRREAIFLTGALFLCLTAISVVRVVLELGDLVWLLLYGLAALVFLPVVAWWQYFGRERFPLPSDADPGPYVPKRLRELVEQSNDVQHNPK